MLLKKNTKIILLASVILLLIVFNISRLFNRNDKVPSSQNILTPAPSNSANEIKYDSKLFNIIERNPSKNYSSWSQFIDISGYKIYYPSNWYLLSSKGSIYTIQNWDPDKVTNPGAPLSGTKSKWDINFQNKPFTNIDDLISTYTSGMKMESIEKVKTKSGHTVFLIQGTGSFFGDESIRVPILTALFVDKENYFSWGAIYYGGQANAEILKGVAESLDK